MENENIMHDCEQLRDELCAKSEMKKTQVWFQPLLDIPAIHLYD